MENGKGGGVGFLDLKTSLVFLHHMMLFNGLLIYIIHLDASLVLLHCCQTVSAWRERQMQDAATQYAL